MTNAFNRYTNLDNIEWHIIDYLVTSDNKYANYLWKILKYDTPDCLSKPNLTNDEKYALIYTDNGEATEKRVFMSPFIDDLWNDQTSHLHIYIEKIKPRDYTISVVTIALEAVIHNKISNINGDASEYNPETNPVEIRNGEFMTPYKNRATVMLKCLLAALNGKFVNGVGQLTCDRFDKSANQQESGAEMNLWNSKQFYGFKIQLSTMISGVSESSDRGF